MIKSLFTWYFKLFRWYGKFFLVLAAFMLVILPVLDRIIPWDDAVAALKRENPSGVRWRVATTMGLEWTKGEPIRYARHEYFIMLPAVFVRPTVYEFYDGPDIGKGLKVHPYPALRFPVLIVVAGLVAALGFVLLQLLKRVRHKKAAA